MTRNELLIFLSIYWPITMFILWLCSPNLISFCVDLVLAILAFFIGCNIGKNSHD